ncbi:bifunctional diguanylate cyclase/phosphodiesterase [uncultured Sphaerochaeta sp.]|uniref:putative bifunctional diguanylate cyclase/phosphodiesterase n=1 Tax=uncultured Sphaerochaeta sp. TaxID=886478 RepID=UPI0029CA2B0B|nr:bifunctional diguanylate cyclase/phosphodiesterase [uncultured Sphaerochaeta sp.]
MELVVMELFLLVVVVSIVVSQKQATLLVKHQDIDVVGVAIAYIGYLALAVLSHVHIRGLFPFPPAIARLVTILHIISIPLLIFIWMNSIEKRLLSKRCYSLFSRVQGALLVLFSVASFVDLTFNRLFVFSPELLIIGGPGIPLMLGLSTLFVLVEFYAALVRWKHIEWHERAIMVLTALFLLFSLVLFETFKQPYMLSLSSAFMLLLSFLSWQRKELLLDLLTRIPNNQAFQEALKQGIASRQRRTILLLDIENFRLLNERYGEDGGDAILRSFADFLKTTYEQAGVFRIGGNRFVLMFPWLTHNELVREVNLIKEKTTKGCTIGETQVSFHVNIAIVEIPLQKNTVDEVVESLSFTMTEIKEKRRQPVIIFNQKLIGVRQRRLDILSILRKALLEQDMIQVYFQPIMDIDGNKPVAAEALMRLQDERMGIISPGEFIPLAEQAGLISMYTEIMLQKVCAFLLAHPSVQDRLSHVSINIVAEDLAVGDVACKLLDMLSQKGIDEKKIGFEVTESMVLSSDPVVTKSWQALRNMGVRFFLDDFGTGYANLESLVNLPFDVVKIDRSVVSNTTNSYELLSLIAGMLQRLGKEVIAEGVETLEQLERVKSNRISYVQGYYFSKPLPPGDFLSWLEASSDH